MQKDRTALQKKRICISLQRNVPVNWVESLIPNTTATGRTTSGSNLQEWYKLGSWKKIWHDSRLNCRIPGPVICISLNENSNYCYKPRSSKHTDTCKWLGLVLCSRSRFNNSFGFGRTRRNEQVFHARKVTLY